MSQSKFVNQLKRKLVNNLILAVKNNVIPAVIERLNKKAPEQPQKIEVTVISSEPNK